MQMPLRQQPVTGWPADLFSHGLVRRVGLGFITFVLLTTLVSLQWLPRRLYLEEGKPAPRDLTAPKTVTYFDEEKTEELRENAARLVEPVYDPDISVLNASLEKLQTALSVIREVRKEEMPEELPPEEQTVKKAELLEQRLGLALTASCYRALLELGDDEITTLERAAPELVREIMQEGVRETDLPVVREDLGRRVEAGEGTPEYKEAVRSLAGAVLAPNLVLNEEETERRRREARESIRPVEQTIIQNTMIVRQHDLVTAEAIKKLKALGLLQQKTSWTAVLGVALMVLLMMGLVVAYLRILAPKVAGNEKLLLLLSLIAVGTLSVGRLFLLVPHTLAAYLFPVATGPLLVAILLDSRLAVLVAAELALLA
ncbi:MAG: hypothetical protein GX062_07725, partial [Firmicutes bacterium]|nr:hypothetical protein [Bacillota bacterium]